MLRLEEAVARCMAAALPVRTERVPTAAAAGRVLVEDVRAVGPQPPWDNSAMDGYAVIAADFAEGRAELDVLETIAAGSVGTVPVRRGTTSRIMTGAPLPEGADAIVIRENSEPLVGRPERVRLVDQPRPGQQVRLGGEELQAGDLVLPAGTTLGPAHVGLCASVGVAELAVARRPRVGVIATGDEIVMPGGTLGPGQIFASNSQAILAWVTAAGGEAIDCGIARDTLQSTKEAFSRALSEGCDFVVSTGGVSVGDFDVVKEAMEGVGAAMDFWKVRVKPGKPLAFGRIGDRPAFGLPGNPVSCQVGFLQFVRPVIRASLGDPNPYLPVVTATLADGHPHRPGRAELVRVRLRVDGGGFVAHRTGHQGSGRSSSMAQAHGLALVDADSEGVAPGSAIAVQVYDWSFLAGSTPGYRW